MKFVQKMKMRVYHHVYAWLKRRLSAMWTAEYLERNDIHPGD